MKLFSLNKSKNAIIESIIKLLIYPDNINESSLPLDDRLIKWLKSHDLEYSNNMPSKRGSQGIVYFFGDKVVKISNDKTEAKVANILKGNSDIVSVIDVHKMADNTWAILQYKVNFNYKHPIVLGFDYLAAYLDDNKVNPNNSVDEISNQIRNKIKPNNNVDIESAVKIWKKLYELSGFYHDDPDRSNVGLLNGNVVFTDLGPKK